eukprot:2335017-Pleurochrysis_carterae.AAC.1
MASNDADGSKQCPQAYLAKVGARDWTTDGLFEMIVAACIQAEHFCAPAQQNHTWGETASKRMQIKRLAAAHVNSQAAVAFSVQPSEGRRRRPALDLCRPTAAALLICAVGAFVHLEQNACCRLLPYQ